MDIKTIQRMLEVRELLYQGLYRLMTTEERHYFWAREISALLARPNTNHDTSTASKDVRR